MGRLKSYRAKAEKSAMPSLARPGEGLTVMSFFTGCGGLDLGFEQAGFKTIYATDIIPACCETLELNRGRHFNAEMKVECRDITDIKPSSLPSKTDLIIGGPPCQSFSASGRRAGGAAGRLDQRGTLFEAYCKIIDRVRPRAFVFENVRGILGTNKGDDWKAIVRAFGRIGYTLNYRLLDALDYGVPQQRERMFLVGHQMSRPFLFPEPTHGPDSANGLSHVTAGKAFDCISETEDTESLKLLGGKYSHLLPLVPPGENYLHFTAKRGCKRPIFAYRSRFSDFLYKASPDAPVKTIIASPGKYTGPLHWDNRYFSVREYMRLQGFPDNFIFSGGRDTVVKQIGNSVSPKIAYQLALAIAQQVFGIGTAVRLLDANRELSFDKRKGLKAQRTRAMHNTVANARSKSIVPKYFSPVSYTSKTNGEHPVRVVATADTHGVKIRVETDSETRAFARMLLAVRQTPDGSAPLLTVSVAGYGKNPRTAQAMWDAVDEWVRRSSEFHSLFELYGHFTEPHPLFSVIEFDAISKHPVALFAAHAANFANCSRYFPKSHLVQLFNSALSKRDFAIIAEYLRGYRFDIRSQETNVAIGKEAYMVAYPFTLPARKQMNFRVRDEEKTSPRAMLKALA